MSSVAEPSPAEHARTLAGGVVPGALHLPAGSDDGHGCASHRPSVRIRHLADTAGQVYLLVDDDSSVRRRLTATDAPIGLAQLDVLDVPPGWHSLPRARLGLTGWVESIPATHQRRAAEAIAAARPVAALLGVGAGASLYRFDVADITLTTASGIHRVDPAAYAAAEPDPFYDHEDHLAGHLQRCHAHRLASYAQDRLSFADAALLYEVGVVGVDRYGIDLRCAVGTEYRFVRVALAALGDTSMCGQPPCRELTARLPAPRGADG